MIPNERYFRKVISAVGGALLIFWGLINIVGTAAGLLPLLLTSLHWSEKTVYIVYQTVYGCSYFAAFMIPAAFLKLFLKNQSIKPMRMDLQPRISPFLPILVIVGIAVIWSFSYVNTALVDLISYSEFMENVLGMGSAGKMEPYEVAVQFFVICLVPGLCEEFLFRGAILTNLRPFGRSNAVLISSFLFAMMHQNAAQILYAFAAGIFLGLVYEKTGSIWNTTILHTLNNFAGILISQFQASFPAHLSGIADIAAEMILIFLGILFSVILIVRLSRKNSFPEGVYGKSYPTCDSYAACPIGRARAVSLFLCPTMIVFLSLCVGQILFLCGMAVLNLVR